MDYLEFVIKEDIHVQHPKEELSKFADRQKMKYTTTLIEEPEPRWSCGVTIGERLVGEVESSLNKVEAMTKAAENAIRLLTEEMNAVNQQQDAMDAS
jgi:hypothetical protein